MTGREGEHVRDLFEEPVGGLAHELPVCGWDVLEQHAADGSVVQGLVRLVGVLTRLVRSGLLDVLYEDAHLIVFDKPAGLVVHPAPGNPDGTLVNALLAHCGDSLQGIGGERRPGIVHRLDKDTSGLMVAAKTEAAHRRLS